MKIKVLVVITTAFVPYGGLTSVMMNYYRAIDKSKIHIDFASTNTEVDRTLLEELNKNGSEYFGLGNRKKHLIRYITRLNTVLKKKKYDIIHINSNSATAGIELMIAYTRGVEKRIVHNHTSVCDHKILNNIMYPLFRHLYTDAIACSDKAGKWLFKDKYKVLNNGIDAERYRFNEQMRNEIREKYNISSDTIVVGHLGKIYKPKNHHFIVEIFDDFYKKHPESRLLLVGDGEMRQEVEADVKSRGLSKKVVFAGMQRNTNAYLSAMDVFVFPSIWEGMPLSMIEAQASGLCSLASDTIDKNVVVTSLVSSLSINNGSYEWTKKIENINFNYRAERSNNAIESIRAAGFDSNYNALELEAIYTG